MVISRGAPIQLHPPGTFPPSVLYSGNRLPRTVQQPYLGEFPSIFPHSSCSETDSNLSIIISRCRHSSLHSSCSESVCPRFYLHSTFSIGWTSQNKIDRPCTTVLFVTQTSRIDSLRQSVGTTFAQSVYCAQAGHPSPMRIGVLHLAATKQFRRSRDEGVQ